MTRSPRPPKREPLVRTLGALKTPGWIMGVLNVTPDSFYVPSRLSRRAELLRKARAMIQGGAQVLDVGAESTRPGAPLISSDVESTRLLPAIQALRKCFPTHCISVDTQKASVAEAALRAGASMINDISALRYDPGMADVIA